MVRLCVRCVCIGLCVNVPSPEPHPRHTFLDASSEKKKFPSAPDLMWNKLVFSL